MRKLNLSSMMLVIFLAVGTNVSYCMGSYGVLSQGWTEDHNDYEVKGFRDLDSATKYWLNKYCRTKILYDSSPLMSYSSQGRVADLMGDTSFFTTFFSRNTFERGSNRVGHDNLILFREVAVVAYYHDIDQSGVRIEAMAKQAKQLRSEFDQLQASAKILFQWSVHTTMGPGGITSRSIVCRVEKKQGDRSMCDKLAHILKAMDHGHLYNQVYMKYVVAWCQEQELHLAHFDEEQHAMPLFETLQNCTAKILVNRDSDAAVREHAEAGRSGMIRFLKRAVATLNQVIPMGTWGASAKNARTWYDCIAKKYWIQVTLGDEKKLVETQVAFDPRYNHYNCFGNFVEGDG